MSSKITHSDTSESIAPSRMKGTGEADPERRTGGIYSVACGCRSLCFDWLEKVGACPRGMPWDCPARGEQKAND